jgi:hypothetical protein
MATIWSDLNSVEVVIYANREGEIFVRPEIEFFDVIAPRARRRSRGRASVHVGRSGRREDHAGGRVTVLVIHNVDADIFALRAALQRASSDGRVFIVENYSGHEIQLDGEIVRAAIQRADDVRYWDPGDPGPAWVETERVRLHAPPSDFRCLRCNNRFQNEKRCPKCGGNRFEVVDPHASKGPSAEKRAAARRKRKKK